jgi:hypothetical protein
MIITPSLTELSIAFFIYFMDSESIAIQPGACFISDGAS